jgi:5-hydroxyisourate hydrolase-like protein (transthyretin family)
MGADEVSTGSVSGTVTDAKTGKPLAPVKVTLYDSGGKVGTTKTSSDGYYEFTDLPAETYRLKFSKKGYKAATVKNVTVPPDQKVNVALKKEGKSPASIAWVAPPKPRMAAGENQTVRWRVTGEEITGTALVCSAGEDPAAQAVATTVGIEVAPGEYKATINAVSPGTWHYAAVAEVDGDTIATKPVAVTVK